MTPPSQRAREAAARLFASYSRGQDVRSDNARNGLIDDSETVQAFAQFEAETLERAAGEVETLIYHSNYQYDDTTIELAAKAIRESIGDQS